MYYKNLFSMYFKEVPPRPSVLNILHPSEKNQGPSDRNIQHPLPENPRPLRPQHQASTHGVSNPRAIRRPPHPASPVKSCSKNYAWK